MRRLKQIKFLRKLGVPITQIQKLFEDSISLDACLLTHLKDLDRAESDLQETRNLTRRALDMGTDRIDRLDIDACLEDIARSEKEGTRFMNINVTDVHRKKSAGAVIGASIMIVFMGVMLWLILWANTQEPLPSLLLVFLGGIPVIVIICTLVVLVQRLNEIKGGEEDDAAQY